LLLPVSFCPLSFSWSGNRKYVFVELFFSDWTTCNYNEKFLVVRGSVKRRQSRHRQLSSAWSCTCINFA
jgi:hypothetical protein